MLAAMTQPAEPQDQAVTPEAVEESTVADAVDETLTEAESAPEGEYSIADAWREATAEAEGGQPRADKVPDFDEKKPEPVEPAPTEEAGEPEPAADPIAALLRKVEEGRFAELTESERDVFAKVKDRALAEEKQEAEFREFYLSLAREKDEDPVTFWEKVDKDIRILNFMKGYEAAHPDVTLETPAGRPKTEAQIRQELDREYVSALTEATKAVATKAGLTEAKFDELAKAARNKPGATLSAVFEEAVNTAVDTKLASERERIAAEEREAVRRELEAQYASRNSVRYPSAGSAPNPNAKTPHQGEYTIRDAWREAEAELASR